MKINITPIKSSLHNKDALSKQSKEFIDQLEITLKEKVKITSLDDYDCDLKLIFIETGGSEGYFLEQIANIKSPVYLLTNNGNNSLAASLEILTYLRNNNIDGEIIHGSINYEAKRIKELTNENRVINELRSTKLGVLGKPSNWLISSIPDYSEIKNKFGITLVDYDLNDLVKIYNSIENTDNQLIVPFSKNELSKANKLYFAMKSIIKNDNLNGITIRCFDLLTMLKSTGCLGLALLNQEGFIATCEGDIMAMITMCISSLVTGNSTFQANPSEIDVENREVIFAHCTVPINMVENYSFDTHFESRSGIAIKGNLKEENVTIFRISSNLKDYFIEEGKIVENLNRENLCRTQIKVKFDNDISQLLTKPCGNHHIIFYGNYKNQLISLMSKLLK